MASTMLGRTCCPECDFKAAHVKISDKENAKAYRHCPECGAQYFPRNKEQADRLLTKTRAVDAAPEPAPAPVPAPAPEPEPAPTPAPKGFRYVLGCKVPL